jgi:branched-chain amino acid transport system substrate-binding protein
MFKTLSAGIAKAKSTDPVAVAKAMEGLTVRSYAGEITMRATDHQLQQPLFFATWQKTDAKNPYNVENTGMTPGARTKDVPAVRVEHADVSCQMKRP